MRTRLCAPPPAPQAAPRVITALALLSYSYFVLVILLVLVLLLVLAFPFVRRRLVARIRDLPSLSRSRQNAPDHDQEHDYAHARA